MGIVLENQDQCTNICDVTPNCKIVTFNGETGRCRLFSSGDEVFKANGNKRFTLKKKVRTCQDDDGCDLLRRFDTFLDGTFFDYFMGLENKFGEYCYIKDASEDDTTDCDYYMIAEPSSISGDEGWPRGDFPGTNGTNPRLDSG